MKDRLDTTTQAQYKYNTSTIQGEVEKDLIGGKDSEGEEEPTIQEEYKYNTSTIQVRYKIDLNEIDKRNPDRLGENEENIKTKDNF